MLNTNSDDLSRVSSNSDQSNIAVRVVSVHPVFFQSALLNLEWDPTVQECIPSYQSYLATSPNSDRTHRRRQSIHHDHRNRRRRNLLKELKCEQKASAEHLDTKGGGTPWSLVGNLDSLAGTLWGLDRSPSLAVIQDIVVLLLSSFGFSVVGVTYPC